MTIERLTQPLHEELVSLDRLQQELEKTQVWFTNWEEKLRREFDLDLTTLDKGRGIAAIKSGPVELPFFGWTMHHHLPAFNGEVSVLQLARILQDRRHPLMSRIFYRDLPVSGEQIGASFSWQSPHSPILTELLSQEEGQVQTLSMVTVPGFLFPVPIAYPYTRLNQRCDLRFYWSEGQVTSWEANIGFESKGLGTARFEDGSLEEIEGTHLIHQGEAVLPRRVNPIAYIENFLDHKKPLPLTTT